MKGLVSAGFILWISAKNEAVFFDPEKRLRRAWWISSPLIISLGLATHTVRFEFSAENVEEHLYVVLHLPYGAVAIRIS